MRVEDSARKPWADRRRAPANPHRPPVTAAWRISSTASRSTRQEPSRPRHSNGPAKTVLSWLRAHVSGADVVVESLGFDANLGFQPGQWVELSDDSYLFGPTPNRPGELCQIKSINAEQRTLTMTAAAAQVDPSRHATLRRWEQFGTSATSSGVVLAAGSWLDLENGVQVQFAPGNFDAGDYWVIPARTATGEVEWPPCGGDGAAFQPPHRTEIWMAPLACIHWDPNKQTNFVEDCRRSFPPLTDVAGGSLSALHVTGTNWNNDDVLSFDQLLATGLAVTLDHAPTGRIDSSIFDVTLEVPVASPVETAAVQQGLTPIVLRTAMPIDGQVTANQQTVTWNLPFRNSKGEIAGLQLEALVILDLMLQQGISYSSFVRARVRLSGAVSSPATAPAACISMGKR